MARFFKSPPEKKTESNSIYNLNGNDFNILKKVIRQKCMLIFRENYKANIMISQLYWPTQKHITKTL
jgi:hypothetical protein